MTLEQKARVSIDVLLQQAGWHVCNVSDANIHTSIGVAIREFPLNSGFGFADYLLYVHGKACGVIEAQKQGAALTGMELQSSRHARGLPLATLAEQARIVVEFGSHLYLICEVEAEVNVKLKRAQVLRQATLLGHFLAG